MLGAKEIKEILPHRYPFLMIDRVEEVEEGKRAKGFKNISINEEFFNGHFPDYPVMPGVLILEALAQMGAICILSKEEFKGKGKSSEDNLSNHSVGVLLTRRL